MKKIFFLTLTLIFSLNLSFLKSAQEETYPLKEDLLDALLLKKNSFDNPFDFEYEKVQKIYSITNYLLGIAKKTTAKLQFSKNLLLFIDLINTISDDTLKKDAIDCLESLILIFYSKKYSQEELKSFTDYNSVIKKSVLAFKLLKKISKLNPQEKEKALSQLSFIPSSITEKISKNDLYFSEEDLLQLIFYTQELKAICDGTYQEPSQSWAEYSYSFMTWL